jgi:hypothetical protein
MELAAPSILLGVGNSRRILLVVQPHSFQQLIDAFVWASHGAKAPHDTQDTQQPSRAEPWKQ